MDNALSGEQIGKLKNVDKDKHVKDTHYRHLHVYMHKIIQNVVSEQTEDEADTYTDKIDELVAIQRKQLTHKRCYQCNFEDIPKTKHTCPKCKANVTKSKMKSMGIDENGNAIVPKTIAVQAKEYRVRVEKGAGQRHSFTVSHEEQDTGKVHEYSDYLHLSQAANELPTVHVQEPAYVNPCSYEAVATVMRNIGYKAGVKAYGGDREWVVIVCDDVPYNLCSRIIRCSHKCSVCNQAIYGQDACAKHQNSEHLGEEMSFAKEFDWVLLRPGLGHIEMNMVKSYVELTWDIFWREMIICFNFRSETAQQYAKKVSDHHKGWTLCRIARLSIASELVVPFVRAEKKKETPDFSVAAFFKFVMNAQDVNYTFMADLLFELLDAIFMFRVGVRCGIPDFTEAAQAKFAKVWSGRHHPLYRELEMASSVQQLRMPSELQEFVLTTESLNLSGSAGTGEGADFRLEEVNRQVQQWLPNVPSASDWKRACTNFDQLGKFRDQVFKQMNINDPKLRQGIRTPQNIDDEVKAFRARLRETSYLLSPNIAKQHTSMTGAALDHDLKDFWDVARERRAKYVDIFLEYEVSAALNKPSPPTYKEFPVFITEEERRKYTAIENLTIADIKGLVELNLQTVVDCDLCEELTRSWTAVGKLPKRSTKAVILAFYHELQGYISDQNPEPDFQDQSDT